MFRSHKKEKRELISRIMDHETDTNPPPPSDKALDWNLRRKIFIGVTITIVITIIIVINIIYYNRFVNLVQGVKDARSDIETTLQLRENMVPSILTTINNFINHENEIFINAANVRARSLENRLQSSESGSNPPVSPVAADEWDILLSQLLAIAENYPDLKTGEPFVLLMSKIADAELEILTKRVEYNKKVRDLNITVNSFPALLFSFMFEIKTESYFQWTGTPEWVTTLDEETRNRTDEILENWRSTVIGADTTTVR
ncbi:LemA family protein [candidate division KSB1 bacterium]